MALATRVPIEWPHSTFRPSGLACAGSSLGLADRFEVHGTNMSDALQHWENGPTLSPLLRAHEVKASWKSFALLPCAHDEFPDCNPTLLLLQRSGQVVVEHDVQSATGPRFWPLGPALNGTLSAITLAGDQEASLCRFRRNPTTSWALLGATDSNLVVVLCPIGDRLETIRTTLETPQESNVEVVGLHSDASRRTWLLTRGQDGSAKLQAWTEGGVSPLATWRLPVGRYWAPGLCGLPMGHGLLVATTPAPLGSRHTSEAEIWRILPEALGLPSHRNEGAHQWASLRLDL